MARSTTTYMSNGLASAVPGYPRNDSRYVRYRTYPKSSPLTLARADDDEHHAGRQGSGARPGWNRVFLRHFGLHVADLEDALVARIRGTSDENEKACGNQNSAHDLQNSHVIPLQEFVMNRKCSRCAGQRHGDESIDRCTSPAREVR